MLVQIKYLGKKKIFFPLAYTNEHWRKSVKQSIIYLFIYPSRYRCFGFYGSVSLVPVFPQIYSFSFSCFAGPGSYNPGSTASWLMVIRNENLSCEIEKEERSQSIFLSPSLSWWHLWWCLINSVTPDPEEPVSQVIPDSGLL